MLGQFDTVLGQVWRLVGHFGGGGWEPCDVAEDRTNVEKHRKSLRWAKIRCFQGLNLAQDGST